MRDCLNHADNPTSYRCGQQGGRLEEKRLRRMEQMWVQFK